MWPIDTPTILTGVVVFLRITGILLGLPFFGDNPTPVKMRILLAAAMSFALYPILSPTLPEGVEQSVTLMFFMIGSEMILGICIGFLARLFFDAVVSAAAVVGYQMGFGTANLFMPDSSTQLDGFTALHRIFVLVIFLSLNLHHIFIKSIIDSFLTIPLGALSLTPQSGVILIEKSANLFAIAFQLSAPVLVALLFTMAALGLIARTVPQMNVFTQSFPASFFTGLLIYIAIIPFFPDWFRDYFMRSGEDLIGMLSTLVQRT